MDSAALRLRPTLADLVLEVRRLSCSYGRRVVVRDVSFEVHRGEALALIGPSGAGKTTVLRALNRLHELAARAAVQGSVRLCGEAVIGAGALGVDQVRRRVGYVFQRPNPFPMSVYDNVALPLREHRLVADERDCAQRVRSLLTRVGLLGEIGDRLHDSALALSGGQ